MTTTLGTTDSDDAWCWSSITPAPFVNNAYVFSTLACRACIRMPLALCANLVRCVYDANLQWTSNGTGTAKTLPLSTCRCCADTAGTLPTVPK